MQDTYWEIRDDATVEDLLGNAMLGFVLDVPELLGELLLGTPATDTEPATEGLLTAETQQTITDLLGGIIDSMSKDTNYPYDGDTLIKVSYSVAPEEEPVDFEAMFEELKNSIAALESSIAGLNTSDEAISGAVEGLQATVDGLKGTLEALQAAVDGMNGENEALQAAVEALQSALDDANEQLQASVGGLEDEMGGVQEGVEGVAGSVDTVVVLAWVLVALVAVAIIGGGICFFVRRK